MKHVIRLRKKKGDPVIELEFDPTDQYSVLYTIGQLSFYNGRIYSMEILKVDEEAKA